MGIRRLSLQLRTLMLWYSVLLTRRISPAPYTKSQGQRAGERICSSIIGLHAFTGCDTMSAFAGRGNLSALKLMKENPIYQDTFDQLGMSWDVSEELLEKLEQFTCDMYYAGSSTREVNGLRYQLFCDKRGEVESSQLPPCRDSLTMHVLRANYQAAIWKACLEASPVTPKSTDHGWIEEEGQLKIHWMRSQPAPDVVLDLLACKCARVWKLPSCTCLAIGLPSTDMCKLQTCSNQKTETDEDEVFEVETRMTNIRSNGIFAYTFWISIYMICTIF